MVPAGTITIHGGTVKAIGGEEAAGIGGGGWNGSGGTITINGGGVNATGGDGGAGIGGGDGGSAALSAPGQKATPLLWPHLSVIRTIKQDGAA